MLLYIFVFVSAEEPLGARCVEPRCERFGDPNMENRCTAHYQRLLGQPMNPPRENYITTSTATIQQPRDTLETIRYNIGEQQIPIPGFHKTQNGFGHVNQNLLGGDIRRINSEPQRRRTAPTESRRNNNTEPMMMNHQVTTGNQYPEFQRAMTHVENTRKTKFACKTPHCSNFGNSRNSGFCNSCVGRQNVAPGMLTPRGNNSF